MGAGYRLQLAHIHCIIIFCTSCHVMDLLTTHGNIVLCNADGIIICVAFLDGQAAAIDSAGIGLIAIPGGIGGAVQARQILVQLDSKSSIALIIFRRFHTHIGGTIRQRTLFHIAVRMIGIIGGNITDDIHLMVQRHIGSFAEVAMVLLAVIHGGHFMVASGIAVNDAAGLFYAIDSCILFGIQSLSTIIGAEVNGCTVFAIGAFRTGEADMACAVFTGNGNGILSVLSGNTDGTIDAIPAIKTVRTGDGNTGLTVFSIIPSDKETIFTVFSIVANNNRGAAFGIHRNLAISTICAFLANRKLVVQLDVVSQLAVGALHGCNVKIIRFSAGIVAIGLITGSRNGGIRLVINCNSRMGAGYRFQLGHVHRIGVERACRHVRNLAGNGLFSTHITNRYGTCRRRPGAVVGRIYGGRFQIGFLFHAVHFISCGPGGGRPIAQSHCPVHIGTGRSPQSRRIGSRRSGIITQSHRLRSIK